VTTYEPPAGKRGVQASDGDQTGGSPLSVTDPGDNFVPVHRPWRGQATEQRFREDREQWHRRIFWARLLYDGWDPVAPGGRWSA
jgi:hypothetical protein